MQPYRDLGNAGITDPTGYGDPPPKHTHTRVPSISSHPEMAGTARTPLWAAGIFLARLPVPVRFVLVIHIRRNGRVVLPVLPSFLAPLAAGLVPWALSHAARSLGGWDPSVAIALRVSPS